MKLESQMVCPTCGVRNHMLNVRCRECRMVLPVEDKHHVFREGFHADDPQEQQETRNQQTEKQ